MTNQMIFKDPSAALECLTANPGLKAYVHTYYDMIGLSDSSASLPVWLVDGYRRLGGWRYVNREQLTQYVKSEA